MTTRPSCETDSVLQERVEGIKLRCAEHLRNDAEIRNWMQGADRDLARIKFLGVLLITVIGAFAGLSRWLVESAVTEVLVKHQVIEVHRATAMLHQ